MPAVSNQVHVAETERLTGPCSRIPKLDKARRQQQSLASGNACVCPGRRCC